MITDSIDTFQDRIISNNPLSDSPTTHSLPPPPSPTAGPRPIQLKIPMLIIPASVKRDHREGSDDEEEYASTLNTNRASNNNCDRRLSFDGSESPMKRSRPHGASVYTF